METAGIRALKQNASAVVARAAAGDSITITDRGRPVARLVPLEETILEHLIISGRATAPRRRLTDLTLPDEPGQLSDVLREMRDEERY